MAGKPPIVKPVANTEAALLLKVFQQPISVGIDASADLQHYKKVLYVYLCLKHYIILVQIN